MAEWLSDVDSSALIAHTPQKTLENSALTVSIEESAKAGNFKEKHN